MTLPMRNLVLFAILFPALLQATTEISYRHLIPAECGNLLAGFDGREPFYQTDLERLRNSNSFGLLLVSAASLEAKVESRAAASASWTSFITGVGREAEAFPSKDAFEIAQASIQGVAEARAIKTLARARDAKPRVGHHAFDGLLAEWLTVIALARVENTHSLLSQTPTPEEIAKVRQELAMEKATRAEVLGAFAQEDSSTRDLNAFSSFLSAGVESQIASAKQYASKKGIQLPSDEGLKLMVFHLSTVSSVAPHAIGTLPEVLDRWTLLVSELGHEYGGTPLSEFTLCYLALADGDLKQTIATYRSFIEKLKQDQELELRKLSRAIFIFTGSYVRCIPLQKHTQALFRLSLLE
jgi:hypothetical protein